MSEPEREEWWVVRVHGIEQGWARGDPKKLEKPKPFTGWVSTVEWGWQASPERWNAHRFTKRPILTGNAANIGPWWYKIDRCEIIKVERTIITVEHNETANEGVKTGTP